MLLYNIQSNWRPGQIPDDITTNLCLMILKLFLLRRSFFKQHPRIISGGYDLVEKVRKGVLLKERRHFIRPTKVVNLDQRPFSRTIVGIQMANEEQMEMEVYVVLIKVHRVSGLEKLRKFDCR